MSILYSTIAECVKQTAKHLNVTEERVWDVIQFSEDKKPSKKLPYAKIVVKHEISVYVKNKKQKIQVTYNNRTLSLINKNITGFDKDTVFPHDIEILYLSSNKIVNLDGEDGKFRFPNTLKRLVLHSNRIVKLDGATGKFRFPESLTHIDLSYNHIQRIDGENGDFRFPELQSLSLSHNNITNLDGDSGNFRFPDTLWELNMNNNRISNLNGISGNFRFNDLIFLDLDDNEISIIPRWFMDLTISNLLIGRGNPIELTNEVRRYLVDRDEHVVIAVNPNNNNDNNVYNNAQNIHDVAVQGTTLESLNKIAKYPKIIQKSKLVPSEYKHLNTREIHTYFKYSEYQVLLIVENVIAALVSKSKSPGLEKELYKRLRQELEEGKEKCSTGRIGRMINTLSGFVDDVEIKISDASQIGAIIGTHLKKNPPTSRNEVIKDLRDRGICDELINQWMEHYE